MFRSRRRSLAFPQSEHARLAGHLACVWGNDHFKLPGGSPDDPVSVDAFHAGVALHDAGYGPLDDDAIGEMSTEASRRRFMRLMEVELDDAVAEIIVKHHARRLMGYAGCPDLEALCSTRIEILTASIDVPTECFQRIDTITDLCDSIAFHFCFEQPADGTVSVSTSIASTDHVSVRFRYHGERDVTVSPWPFSIDEVCGYMLAYRAPDYPALLEPVVVPYRVRPE